MLRERGAQTLLPVRGCTHIAAPSGHHDESYRWIHVSIEPRPAVIALTSERVCGSAVRQGTVETAGAQARHGPLYHALDRLVLRFTARTFAAGDMARTGIIER